MAGFLLPFPTGAASGQAGDFKLIKNDNEMKREKVKSSNLASVGYDAASMHLDVEFANGGLYRYFEVPAEKYRKMIAAELPGKYFASEIKNAYKAEKISTLDYVIDHLTDDQKHKLLSHFNTIYECRQLSDHEYKIIYLAWLWANGFVYKDENGMSMIDENTSDLPLNAFEITFEAEESGGVNLELSRMYYDLDEIIPLFI